MSFLFYISVFLISIMRISIILNWDRISKRYSIMENKSSKRGHKFFEGSSPKNKEDVKVASYVILYYFSILLSIIGLLSSNWFLFLLVLIIIILFKSIYKLIKVIYKFNIPGIKRSIFGISFTVSTLILIFIPINYFHLGIDVLEQIKNYLYLK